METIYLIIIALVILYLLNKPSQEGYFEASYNTVNIGSQGGIPNYSSPEGMINWLNVSDLEYGKLVSKLQGKDQAVTIRNLI
jgi:hypothetical protein